MFLKAFYLPYWCTVYINIRDYYIHGSFLVVLQIPHHLHLSMYAMKMKQC